LYGERGGREREERTEGRDVRRGMTGFMKKLPADGRVTHSTLTHTGVAVSYRPGPVKWRLW
jgi:hypothetical protein